MLIDLNHPNVWIIMGSWVYGVRKFSPNLRFHDILKPKIFKRITHLPHRIN